MWVNESLSLDEYIGSNVSLRFVFDPYYGGVWQIDNIAIPEIGFYDDVETGNTGWTASEWFIDVITTPLDTANADILLSAPDGTSVSGDEMDWLFDGMVPENVWIYKYTANTPLQAGEWDLTITSNFNGTLDYDAQLLVGYPTDGTDAGSLALDTAASLGVVPIVAAGNEGELGLHTVGSPGASASAVTVGATDHMMDYIAWFSSRGPVGFGVNEIIKPDVIAPGTGVGSTYYLGGYQWCSGTSMATPHVAGAAALLLQADPSLTPAQVKQTLMDTSVDLGETGMDNTYGAGRISAYAAVNATVDLPDPVYLGPDKYELFAGATVDEISVSPFITDNVGDAGGEVDIRQVEAYTYSDYLHFKIITSDTPDLSNSEFYLDLDTDRNPATGAGINDIGADYRIKLNSTGGYLYRMNADEEEFIGDVSIYAGSNCIYAEIYLSNIGQTSSNASFFGVARTGGVDTDTAPDTGHGVYPYADIPIKMVGISWSDKTGAPQAGTNITFSIYQDYPYYGCVFNSTVQTDSSGMATADYVTSQMNPYGFYYVTIQDDKGNSVYDYVYTSVPSQYEYEPPFVITGWNDYSAVRNSTLAVKLTLVTPEWEPYNDNVTLVFGYPWSIHTVSAYLTPVNGTIEYDLDLAGTDIDEYNSGEYYNYIPVRVLNGTLDSYDYTDYVGDVSIIDANFSRVMLDPWAYSAVPGETLDLLVQTMNPYFETPVSKELDGMVYWIREIDVKALGEKVSPAVLVKLDEMRKSTEQGEYKDLLSDEEKAELRKGLAEMQNLGIDYSLFEVYTDITGMAEFNITVPQEDQGVYFGFVYVFDDTGYGSGSFVFVKDPDWHHHTQAPPESNAYDLWMWVDWKANMAGEQWVPEDNFTVNIELREYNSSTGWRAIPNEPVQIYTTTRETKTVTTDLNGMASINFTAPDVDMLNSTCDERCVQVWGITGLLQNGIAVADSGWGHLYIPYEYMHNLTPVTLSISNSELDIHVEYQNSTGSPITDVPSVLDVRRGSWRSVGDMLSEYVRTSTTTYDETIPLSDYGTYSATVASEYNYKDYWSGEWMPSFTMWYDQITYHPFNITTDMMSVYGKGLIRPITVTVRDESGIPMEGVSVYIVEQIAGWWHYGEGNTVDYYWSHVDLNVTDASGEATLLLKTPNADNVWVQYKIGGATSEYSMPYLRSGIFSVIVTDKSDLKPVIDMPSVVEAGTETSITGKVYNYGGVPTNDSVLSLSVDDEHLTDISIGAIQPYGHASFSQPWTPASIGTYQIEAVADATDTNDEADESNNIATKAVTARLPDNIAPAVTIDPVTSPTNVSSQTITGTFNESGSGIDLITVNGVEASISGTAYSAIIGLTEGINPIDVIAVDNAGNSGSNSTTIVLDTIAPAITIDPVSSPTNINSQTITGNFAESGSGLASITVDSVVATISGTAYSATITLSEGSNIVNVVATDNAGNQNTATATIDFVSTSTELLSVGSANALANSTITIPVSVANVENVSGISFDLLYNSSVVIVSNVNASENFTGSSITPNIDNTNGITRVVLTNSDLLSASTETPVIDIVFNVTGGFGSSTSLDLQNVEFSGIEFNPYTPAVVVDGMITVGIKGDFNGNGRVDIGDVAKVAFMVAGKIPEDLNADFNGNGRVDIGDAAKIAFYLAGKVSEL